MKKTLSLLLALLFVLTAIPLTAGAADVISISDEAGLKNIANDLTASYKLTADITLSGSWTPIGSSSNAFSGVFDGGGKTVKGLKVDVSSSTASVYAGLFGYVSGEIKNLKVAGSVNASCTYNSSSSVYAGGIAGYCNYMATVDNCTSSATVTATLAPTAATGSGWLSSAYTGNAYAGGIVGYSASFFSIEECANKGAVTANATVTAASGKTANANAYAGGIVGYGSTAVNCFNTASVTSSVSANGTTVSYAGGLAGRANTIKTSYSSGSSITATGAGTNYAGGAAGELTSASYCYYLKDSAASGVAHPTNSDTPASATALTSSGMNGTKMTGFDYDGVWVSSTFSHPVLFDPEDVIGGKLTVDGTLEYGKVLTANVTAITPAEAQSKLKYQWYRGVYSSESSSYEYTAIENATASTYTLAAADIDCKIMLIVRGKYFKILGIVSGYGGSVKSTGYGPVSKLTPATPAAPTASAVASTSITLNTVSGAQYMMATASSSWLGTTSWSNGSWQDSPTFTGLKADTTYRFYQRIKGDGTTTNDSAQSAYSEIKTADASGNITISGTVAITGNAVFGQTLTADTSAVSPAGVALTYQWYRAGMFSDTAISGATGKTYKLTSDDIGYAIKLKVTANQTGYTGTLTSASTASVASVTLGGTVTVSGTAKVGNTLTANTGSITPQGAALKYQWYRNETAVSGASGNTYALTAADYNSVIKVTVTANETGVTGSVTSNATSVVTAATLGGTVSITGTAAVGSVLTADTSALTPAGTAVTYVWYRGTTVIENATASTYTVLPADADKRIKVTVTANETGVTGSVTSAQTAAVAGAAIGGSVSIKGSAVFGETLSADISAITPPAVTLKYQWYRGSSAISGATEGTYKLVAADIGYAVKLRVTANQTGYSGYLESTATAVVAAISITGSVTVSGSAVCGNVLTAVTNSVAPQILYKYQWYRGSEAINGAVSSTYTLTVDDIGSAVKVSVTAGAAGYTGTLTSSATGTVSKKDAPATPGVPVQKNVTDTTVTLVGTSTYEYKAQYYNEGVLGFGAGWQDYGTVQTAAVFTGLTAQTKYRFAQRTAETADTKASAWSDYTEITTLAQPPAPVAITGTVSITGKLVVGSQLTADVSAVTPSGIAFIYAWYADGVLISGESGSTYTLKASDAGKVFTVSVTADEYGYTGTLTSEPTSAASKAANTAVCPAPTLGSASENSITLTSNTGCEYAVYKNGGYVWQSSAVFTELDAGTEYTFVMRFAETDGAYASAVSAQAKFTTLAEYIRGDVDGNKKVETTDARIALRVAAQLDPALTGTAFAAGDMDNDSKISTTDARRILRIAAHLSEV